jgi:hypothetical protein
MSDIAESWHNVVVACDDPAPDGIAPIDRVLLLELSEEWVGVVEKLVRDKLFIDCIQRNTCHEELQKVWEIGEFRGARRPAWRSDTSPNRDLAPLLMTIDI